MFFEDVIEPLGTVDTSLISHVRQFVADRGFLSDNKYDRKEATLKGGRVYA